MLTDFSGFTRLPRVGCGESLGALRGAHHSSVLILGRGSAIRSFGALGAFAAGRTFPALGARTALARPLAALRAWAALAALRPLGAVLARFLLC